MYVCFINVSVSYVRLFYKDSVSSSSFLFNRVSDELIVLRDVQLDINFMFEKSEL